MGKLIETIKGEKKENERTIIFECMPYEKIVSAKVDVAYENPVSIQFLLFDSQWTMPNLYSEFKFEDKKIIH